jgi:hypothetical protein
MGYTGLDIELQDWLRSQEWSSKAKQIVGSTWNLYDSYTVETFKSPTTFAAWTVWYGNPTGSTWDTNIMRTRYNTFEYHIKGTQTILAPVWWVNGLNVAMDQTANDWVEITQWITSRSPAYYTVGTEAFYFEVTFKPADVSWSDDCAFWFRKAEAYQAAIDDYDEMAAFNNISWNLYIETILNNGATSSTDTSENIADWDTVTLRLECDLAWKVTFFYNWEAPSTTVTFTFDSWEKVIPFFYFLQDTDLMDTLYITQWETGKLENSVNR